MADIIDKIGKYFAEQEAQLRQVYSQAATHAALPPSATHWSSSTKPQSHQQPPSRQQPANEDTLSGRNTSKEQQPPSLLRRRLSLQSRQSSSANSTDMSFSSHPPPKTPTAPVVKSVPPVIVPSLAFPPAISKQPASAWMKEDTWSEINDDEGFTSWRSSSHSSYELNAPAISQADTSAARPEVESSDDDDEQESRSSSSSTFSLTKPRKLPLKRRGSVKKKWRSTKPTEPDPEQVRREKEQKVAAALILAQERARRIQVEREQQLRERELANHEEQRRVQEEMEKIEAIRLKSKQFALRLRPSSAPTTPGAPSTSGFFSSRSTKSQLCSDTTPLNNSDNISECSGQEDISASESHEKDPPSFLDKMERQVRERMVLELRIHERALSSQQAQELEWHRLCSQLDKQNIRNEKKQQRLTTLEASKQSLERELAKVQKQLQHSQSQWLELEETSRRERAQRQREAERQLRARMRTEERNRMLEDEKVHSEVAAGARERASQRVVSRALSLKKMLHSHNDLKDHARRPSRSNNNNNEDDEELSFPRTSRQDAKPRRAALLFAPELAEFEEEGLLADDLLVELAHRRQPEASTAALDTADPQNETDQAGPSVPEMNSLSSPGEVKLVDFDEPKFEWRVPPFEDRALIDRVLMHDMLSDSD